MNPETQTGSQASERSEMHDALKILLESLYFQINQTKGLCLCVNNGMIDERAGEYRNAFEYYYRDANGLLREAYSVMKDAMEKILVVETDADGEAFLDVMFRELGKQKLILKIMTELGNAFIWEGCCQPVIRKVAKDWDGYSVRTQKYLYLEFCRQLSGVIRIWEGTNFDKAYIPDCVQLMSAWINTDTMVGEAMDEMIAEWV